jgi:anti-sigma B factor antagonist
MIEFFVAQTLPHEIKVVRLTGELNSETADYFFGCMDELIDAGTRRMIIDCRDLKFVSSMGLAMMLGAHHRLAKHGGDVKLAYVESAVAKVLETVRLDRVLDIYPTVIEAQAAFGPPPGR